MKVLFVILGFISMWMFLLDLKFDFDKYTYAFAFIASYSFQCAVIWGQIQK